MGPVSTLSARAAGDAPPTGSTPDYARPGPEPGTSPSIPLVTGGLVTLIGVLGLLGWLLRHDWLRNAGLAGVSMKADTALMLLVLGAELIRAGLTRHRPSRLTGWLPGTVLVLAALTLAEYVTGLTFGIDEWLFTDTEASTQTGPPGRPALLTVACLAGLSGAMLLSYRARALVAGQSLGLLVLLLSYGVVLGHLFGIRKIYAFGNFSLVAVHTAIGLLLIAVGVLSGHPRRGLMHLAGSPYWGGIITRYLVLYVFMAPPLLTALYGLSISNGVLTPQTGLPFVLFVFLFATLLLVYRAANRLDALDARSQQQYRQLQVSQQATNRQAAFYGTVLDTALTAISVFEVVRGQGQHGPITDFRYTLVNRAAVHQSGKDDESRLVGHHLTEVFPGTVAAGVFDRWKAVVETGQPQQFELHYAHDGLDNWTLCSGAPLGNGLVISYTDITAQKQAEREKLQQAAFTDAVLDSVTCGVFAGTAVRGADGHIDDLLVTAVNRQSATALGRTEAELVGQRHNALYPDARTNGAFDLYVRTIETGQPQHLEFFFQDETQSFWVELDAQKLGDGVVATWTDISDRKGAELALQRQNERLQQVINNTQAGLLLARPQRDEQGHITDFRFVLSNTYNASLSGQTVEDMAGELLSTFFPGYQHDDLFGHYVAVVETGVPRRLTFPYDRFGIRGWFDASLSCVDGCILYSYTDVTALKEAELALQRQNDLLMGIVENGKAGISLFDPVRDQSGAIVDVRYVFTNAVNSRNTGRSVAEMTGNTLLTLFPGVGQTEWFARLLRTATTGESDSFLFPYAAEGIRGWFDTLFVKLGDQILFTDLDVSDLKAAELARQEQADLLERVMNTTPTAIVVHESLRDETGEIVDFRMTRINQVAADLLQMPVDRIEYRRISRFFPGILGTESFAHYRRVVETGTSARFEAPLGEGWYDFSVARFGDGVVVAAQDVTPTRQYRQQLELANAELNRSNESLNSYAYVASHDLQEPLRKLISFANILHTQYAPQLAPEVSDILGRINTSAERMRRLIQDLLTYAQAGSRQDTFKQVDLGQVIRELAENELWAALYPTKAELHAEALPTLLADPFQMRQLFQNLLSNALKFSHKGVKPVVSLHCRLVEQALVPATLRPAAEATTNPPAERLFYEISVRDNGIGFDAKYADRIFQVFQRLHGRGQYAGSGIGLAICQKIVERHGGAITATSQPGKGSTFTVFLPVQA